MPGHAQPNVMRITFVSDTYAPQANGVARTLERLVKGLRARGHEVDVIRPAKLGSSEEGMEVWSLPLPGYEGIHVGIAPHYEFLRRWSRARPDVVYVATETPLGVAAIQAARQLGVPVVSGFHTNFQQYLSYYWMSGLEPLATTWLRLVHNASVKTYVPCEEVRVALRREGFDNLELLPKGVDTQLFDPAKRDPALRAQWGAGENGIVGMYVGRLAPEKNLRLLGLAFEEMRQRDPSFRAVVVGDGPKRQEMEAAHPDVIFAGSRTGEDLARHYASADVFVFPSMTETFGNVVMESMASGLVTVAYRYAAPGEHMKHGVNGFLATLGDESAFLRNCGMAMDRRHWDDVRREARRTALGLSWCRVIDRFQESLEEIAGQEPQYLSPLRSLFAFT